MDFGKTSWVGKRVKSRVKSGGWMSTNSSLWSWSDIEWQTNNYCSEWSKWCPHTKHSILLFSNKSCYTHRSRKQTQYVSNKFWRGESKILILTFMSARKVLHAVKTELGSLWSGDDPRQEGTAKFIATWKNPYSKGRPKRPGLYSSTQGSLFCFALFVQ